MKFPIEFKECPICGESDTICRQAMADEPSLSNVPPLPVDVKISPIQSITGISTPSIKVLLRHYDTCSGCGKDRCIRIEKTTLPTDMFLKMMGVGAMMGRQG